MSTQPLSLNIISYERYPRAIYVVDELLISRSSNVQTEVNVYFKNILRSKRSTKTDKTPHKDTSSCVCRLSFLISNTNKK